MATMTLSANRASAWRVLRRVSFVSSRASSLASAYMPRRHPRLRRVPLARYLELVFVLNERLVCKPLSGHSVHEAVDPRQGMVLNVSLVQPERKFINVAVQMLRAGVMIDAEQTSLQDRKNAFHAICRHVAANIFARAVIDRVMVETGIADAGICATFVSVQRRSRLYVPMDSGLDRLLVCFLDWHSDRASAALTHAENGGLADRVPRPAFSFLDSCLFVSFPPT